MLVKKSLILLFFLLSFNVFSQERPFWPEIKEFKREDSIKFPPKKAILFVGSSSFRFWKTMQEDFPKHRIINRGFGGSGLPNVIDYAADIIYPYKPKQIVIYCGENDFFQGEGITPQIVTERFKQLFSMIRKHLPRVHIVFVSLKPSPRRQAYLPQMAETNWLVSEFLKQHRRTKFVNIYNEMLDASGNPRKELFIEDNLHMNANGYAIWQHAIEPVLKRTKN